MSGSMGDSLRKKSGRALLWSISSHFSTQGIAFFTAAILGRILSPSDFGLIGLLLSINAFLLIFSSAGVAVTIVQHRELTEDNIGSLWGFSGLTGAVIALLLIVLSKQFAVFLNEPRLASIILATAPAIFISAIGQVLTGLLQRDMRFRDIAKANICASVGSAGVAVAMAALGFSYWALVAQILVREAISFLTKFSLCRPLPRPSLDLGLYGRILGFSGNFTLFQLVNYFHRNGDNLLIGKYIGAIGLGFYTRAYLLMTTFNTAIGGVLSPVLQSAMARKSDDLVALRRAYAEIVQILLWVSCPTLGILAGLASYVIRIVWGPGWGQSDMPFFWLAMAGMHQAVFATFGLVFTTRRMTGRLLICGSVTTVVFLFAILLGVREGIESVARNYSLASQMMFIPVLSYVYCRLLEGRFLSLLRIVSLPMITGYAFVLFGLAFSGNAMHFSLQRIWTLVPCGLILLLITVRNLWLRLIPSLRRSFID